MPRPADPNAKIDLLRAAESVFVERGLDHAKVEDITERAGHSKGSFYLHFGSKEDAFRQIIESTLARLAACLDAGEIDVSVRLPAAEHVARWRAHDLEMFEFIWANRRVMRLMLEGGGSAEFGYLIDQFADRTRKQAAEALRLGVAHGLYRADLDVEVASMVLAGGYDRVVREMVRGERKPDLVKLLATLQRVCLTGIASPRLAVVVDQPVKKSARHERNPARIHVVSTRKRRNGTRGASK
jgi:AcrR family transcriptional regulator